MPGSPQVEVWHSWLPLIVPAGARRMRVADPALAATLAAAGAELVDDGAELEIAASAKDLRGEAPVAAVTLAPDLPLGSSRGRRAAARALRSGAMRLRAAGVRSELRRLGYADATILTWEPGLDAGYGVLARGGGALGLVPLRAVVVGRRERCPTLVDEALRQAGIATGGRGVRMQARGGMTLVFTQERILRVALGPASRKLEAQGDALRLLRTLDPPDDVARLVPWTLASGRVGLGTYTLERRLPGSSPRGPMSPAMREECLRFLVALFAVGREEGDAGSTSLATAAELVSTLAPPALRAGLVATGAELDDELAELDRGFAHGDFWVLNLLVGATGLTGVVDWEASGTGRLPLVDLMHFHVHDRLGASAEPGPGLLRELVPWLRTGGVPLVPEYCRRLGLAPTPRQLEALAVAYWLEATAYSIRTYGAQAQRRPGWAVDNVETVAAWLRSEARAVGDLRGRG